MWPLLGGAHTRKGDVDAEDDCAASSQTPLCADSVLSPSSFFVCSEQFVTSVLNMHIQLSCDFKTVLSSGVSMRVLLEGQNCPKPAVTRSRVLGEDRPHVSGGSMVKYLLASSERAPPKTCEY